MGEQARQSQTDVKLHGKNNMRTITFVFPAVPSLRVRFVVLVRERRGVRDAAKSA